MKRIIATLMALITLLGVLTMTSCGNKDGAPKGMQLVKGGDDVGYKFFGPEEWVISNYGDIGCTYVSKIDMSSMTFVETEKPTGTVAEYFESEKIKFPYEITVSVNGDACNFGNAYSASKYIYTYTYKELSYTCMQIFVTHGERFFIFTYTASNAKRNGGDLSYYEYYLEKVQATIEALQITDKTATSATPEYETDADGYKLISDKDLAGFRMYVPASFNVDHSSALVSATHQDGSNVNMSRTTYTEVSSQAYWEARRKNIEAYADKVTNENGELVSTLIQIGDEPTQLKLADTRWALAYEYTYEYEGVKSHVYQVHIVQSATDGYVFTYIAKEENYQTHLAEVEKVLNKIEY